MRERNMASGAEKSPCVSLSEIHFKPTAMIKNKITKGKTS